MPRRALPARRVRLIAWTLVAAGAALVLIAGLGAVAGFVGGSWPLIVLSVVGIAVGTIVALAGLGLRVTAEQAEQRASGADVDVAAAATVGGVGAAPECTGVDPGHTGDHGTCAQTCTAGCALTRLRQP